MKGGRCEETSGVVVKFGKEETEGREGRREEDGFNDGKEIEDREGFD